MTRNNPPLPLWPLAIAAVLFLSSGCAQTTQPFPARPSQPTPQPRPSLAPKETTSVVPGDTVVESVWEYHTQSCPDAGSIRSSQKNRTNCYQLRPATVAGKKKRTTSSSKSKKKKGGKSSPTTAIAPLKPTGLCQPQSLIYARCRTGIQTCRLGNTSPVQWFACAQKNGNTTSIPMPGSVLVLDGNSRRRMPTGHPVYVEAATPNKNGSWTLRISHTNYDRKCHLDLDARLLFDPKHMTASFQSGPWASWASNIQVLGFILR